jgi:2'-phosphotransferase
MSQDSRFLSYVLRHGAQNHHLNIDEEGYIKVNDILQLGKMKSKTLPEIQKIVKNCPKQRFKLKEENGVWYICANQGHSIKNVKGTLKPITDPNLYNTVVHGTYNESYAKIEKSGGLSKMERNHIHFAKGLPGEDGVISGMRKTAEVYIYIDMEKAIKDGIKFYESDNGVILSEGINGIIPLKYFKKVFTR